MKDATRDALFEFTLRLGDDFLVLGHRLSEWCGYGPVLEEDIALANIALDCLGSAANFLRLAGTLEGKQRTEDSLTYFREATEYRNCLLAEQPNGDFASTIARQFLFSSFYCLFFELQKSCSYSPLAEICEKSLKELRYHLRHSEEWVLRLGDGTAESHQRITNAFEDLWPYAQELHEVDNVERLLVEEKQIVPRNLLQKTWLTNIQNTIQRATLPPLQDNAFTQCGGRYGRHSEHLGHMLSELQIVARSYPDARW